MNRIFLGGTCAKTTWREWLIDMFHKDIEYFNPVVEDWTPECIAIENDEKANKCNIHLYVITKEMIGVYSIAEIIDSCNTKGKFTIFHVIPDGFELPQLKSLKETIKMASRLGAVAYIDSDLSRTAKVINNCFSNIPATY